jgi:anti-anti-sigma factor
MPSSRRHLLGQSIPLLPQIPQKRSAAPCTWLSWPGYARSVPTPANPAWDALLDVARPSEAGVVVFSPMRQNHVLMVQQFDVEVVRDHRVSTVRVRGEIDLAAAERLERALQSVQDEPAEVTVLDLREVTFIDSTGLRTITSADARARKNGHELRIVRGSEQVQKLLHVTGMDKILPLVDDPAEPLPPP